MRGETENTDIRTPNSALDRASSTFSIHKSLQSEIPYRKVNPLNVTIRTRRHKMQWADKESLYRDLNLFTNSFISENKVILSNTELSSNSAG